MPFADLMRAPQALSDYSSADTVDQLRGSADAVVEGRLLVARDGGPGVVDIVVDVTSVLTGDLDPGRLVVREDHRTEPPGYFGDALPRGARFVGFLHQDPDQPDHWAFGIEGLWIDCPGGEFPVEGRTPQWAGAYTLDDLVAALGPGGEDVPTCAEVEAFTEIVHNTGIDLDYDPTESPEELAARSDLVIEGRLVGVDIVEGDGVDRSPVAHFRIVVGNTYQGDVLREVTAVLGYGRDDLGAQYEALLPMRARVVAFLFADPSSPGRYAVIQQEGLYVGCPGGDTVDGQGPGWAGIATIDELIDTTFFS